MVNTGKGCRKLLDSKEGDLYWDESEKKLFPTIDVGLLCGDETMGAFYEGDYWICLKCARKRGLIW